MNTITLGTGEVVKMEHGFRSIQVDKVHGHCIRRLCKQGRGPHDENITLGYIGVPTDYIGQDVNLIVRGSTLTEVREKLGFSVDETKSVKTPPKSSYKQNNKGYKAGSGK